MDDADLGALIERMDRRAEQHDRRAEERDRRAEERDRRFLERMRRSEQYFIDALAENTAEIRRLSERHEDMRESIQANTRAVLSVLDRLDGLEGGRA